MEFKPQKLNGTTPVIAASIVDQKSDTAIGDFTCIAPSGRWAVFSSKGYGRVYVIDLASADERMLDKALKYPQAIAISPADVAAITDERGIHIVDLATGKLKSLPMKRASRAFFVQPDVLAVYANDQIDFVDAKSGSPVAKPLRAKTMTSMGMDVSCRGAIAVRTINDDAVDALIWNGHTDPIRVPRPKAARINSGPLGLSFSTRVPARN
jgi:poly-gamma-glutamate capsule biosynthesis protein CapA/YwtB (metallophosphatase superfamily)